MEAATAQPNVSPSRVNSIPTEIDGVERCDPPDPRRFGDVVRFQATPQAGLATAEALVRLVEGSRRLVFFDAAHPRVSEPGVYVIFRETPDGIAVSIGNHGWSEGWLPLSVERATRYLALCLVFHGEESSERIELYEDPDRQPSDRHRSTEHLRAYLDSRLGVTL